MQSHSINRVRDAVAALVVAVLHDLAERDGSPRVGALADLRDWWRHGQESFVALRPNAWHMPAQVRVVGWLDTFTEMGSVRAAFGADPVLNTRVDTGVGTEFSKTQRELGWLLVRHLLEPLIVATRAYVFDKALFKQHFHRLDDGLRSDNIRFVEFIPLNGFSSSVSDVDLGDGVVLREMTDRQISHAIRALAVPAESSGGPNSVQVSRLHQWALMREQRYPVHSDKLSSPEPPRGPDYPRIEEPAQRLAMALRIVCGGSVVATRAIHAQHDDDFPPTVGGSAMMSPLAAADIDRPTQLLTDDQVGALLSVYGLLSDPHVGEDRSLQVALRRFVIAGSKALAADRLIDLVICCEALFLKRNGVGGRQKGRPAAAGAERLLAGDPLLQVAPGRIMRFVATAYRLRNVEVHGDHPVRETMTLLNGATTEDLAQFVEDLSVVVGRALHLTLNDSHTPPRRPT